MTPPRVSFEFFPPRSLEASFRLWDAAQSLAPLDPEFISVTYGAAGSTRALTQDTVKALQAQDTARRVAAHLTCVDQSRQEVLAVADDMAQAGVRDIVALRGDPADKDTGFCPRPDGFASSVQLIEALAAQDRFTLWVGAYPEGHPEAPDMKACVAWLRAKFAAGADAAITQFFFEPETFLRFRDACVKAGIDRPIIPGILPIEDWQGVRRFAARCGTRIPTWLGDAFERAERDGRCDLLATAVATELCDTLGSEGVDHLHFYTLNRPGLTRDICCALGIRPTDPLRKVA